MKKIINILLTGIGAPGTWGTLLCLQQLKDYNITLNIVGTDINDNPVGKYWTHKFYQIPNPESSTYLSKFLNIVKNETIDIIIPQTTRELFILSKEKDIIEKTGARLLCSDFNSILRANDKYEVLNACNNIGLPTPKFTRIDSINNFNDLLKSFGYPKKNVVIKPTISNGMRGVRVLTETIDAFELY